MFGWEVFPGHAWPLPKKVVKHAHSIGARLLSHSMRVCPQYSVWKSGPDVEVVAVCNINTCTHEYCMFIHLANSALFS